MKPKDSRRDREAVMSDPLDPQGPYPNPLPDGTCTHCRISDFTLAQDQTEYSPCEWDPESKTFSTTYGHTQNQEAPDSLRFFCANCGERHMPPEDYCNAAPPRNATPETSTQPVTTEDNTMNQAPTTAVEVETYPIIEGRVFIQGRDAALMTDDQLIETIRKLEGELKHLEAIDHRPQALKQRILDIDMGIREIVVYMDTRTKA